MDMRTVITLIEGAQKLDELQGIKRHTTQTFHTKREVLDYLEEKGFTTLGFGMYGGVFDHPTFNGRYILKVFADPFYERFLEWSAAQPGNPHLPKTFGKVSKLTEDGRMVRIERLEPMSRVIYGGARLGRYVTMLRNPKGMSQPERERIIAFLDEKGLSDLRATLDAVAKAMPQGAEIDLTPENFMMRGETIVISDPYGGARIPFLK